MNRSTLFALALSPIASLAQGNLPTVGPPEPFDSLDEVISVPTPFSLASKVSVLSKEERELKLFFKSCPTPSANPHYENRLLQLLLDVGTDPNALGPNPNRASSQPKRSALIVAAECRNLYAVDALLKAGADTEAKDHHGRTALIKMVGQQPIATKYGYGDIVGRLIQGGANLDATDNNGNTPLMHITYAAMNRSLNTLSFHERASIEEDNDEYDSVLRQLILAKANLNATNHQGDTALTQCVPQDNTVPAHVLDSVDCCPLEMVLTLIEAGIEIDRKNKKGKTALDLATEGDSNRRRENCKLMKIALSEVSQGGTLATIISRLRWVNYTSIHANTPANFDENIKINSSDRNLFKESSDNNETIGTDTRINNSVGR